MTFFQVTLIIIAVLLGIMGILYLVGRKMQSKMDEQKSLIDQHKTVTSILIIDKKKLKAKDANLPKNIHDQIPKYLRFRKLPMVKAKIGPKITTLLCDDKVFNDLPVKKMVKVELAGVYIVGFKGAKK
ncbi:hypothetical protein EDC18_10759 [Natranaerovirga pectinivora]|uniref:Uncharacterized protein n=1 Tax=Natranaerovirga pectinivora TaxID=682400 RepID=A0A4R3MM27_9FIRM|nr:hypothetical protein [Natranaerovirga pectinivora]TCT13990.1 hypothetical protein EDC18_10759 [Natranaerovirga pectinivora]